MSDKSYIPASGETFEVRKTPGGALEVQGAEGGKSQIVVNNTSARIDHQTQRIIWSRSELKRQLFWVYGSKGKRVLSWPGGSMEIDALDLSECSTSSGGKLKPLKLTMPGKVVSVKVAVGEIVQAEQGLLIVEAMKMENLLLAPTKARVSQIHVSPGDRLDSGAVLITFEAAD